MDPRLTRRDERSDPAGTGRSSGLAGPRQLRRLLDAVISLVSDVDLPTLLRHIVDAGRDLVGARYAALGVLDVDRTYLAEFLTVGIDDEGRRAIGELPKGHGILGLLIDRPAPLRLPDLTEHPDRYGFPLNHPPMRSFLGVPVYVQGEVFGNLYFTEKLDGEVFTDIDEELAVALAAAAAIAIQNARLHERAHELTLLADRERLARDLHDTVIQQIFATGLAMHTTAHMAADPPVQERIISHIEDLDDVVRTLRSAIFQLEARRVDASGARDQVLALVAEASRALGFEPLVAFDGPIDAVTSGQVCTNLLSVVRESLANVARHARASAVQISLTATPTELTLDIRDDGVGLGEDRGTGNGLRNIRERARALNGSADIVSCPDGGTAVHWTVPHRE